MILLKKFVLTLCNQRSVFTSAVSEVIANSFHETLFKQQYCAGQSVLN